MSRIVYSTDIMKIGYNLKLLRKQKGVTQKIVADIIDVKVNTYSQYENDIRQPDYKNLLKICDFFKVSIDYFISNFDPDDFDPEEYKERQIIDYLRNKESNIEKAVRRITTRMDTIIESSGALGFKGEFESLKQELRVLFSEFKENQKNLDIFIDYYDVEDDILEHLKF